jgi:hypothetical protein
MAKVGWPTATEDFRANSDTGKTTQEESVMAKNVEQTVTELADREAIRELPIKYCDCVWRGDISGIVDLFAEDGAFITKGRKREHKAEALLKLYGGLTSGDITPRPYIHNHVIDLKGDGRAIGRCYVELRNLQKNMEWAGTGFYEDEYIKAGDGWKFKSRTFQTAYMESMPEKRA